jgi:hypothetical protein
MAERAGLSERGVREIQRRTMHGPRKETVHLLGRVFECWAEGAGAEVAWRVVVQGR